MQWQQAGASPESNEPLKRAGISRQNGFSQGRDGPPDLEEVFREARRKFENWFGNRGGGRGRGDDADRKPNPLRGGILPLVVAAAVGLWLFSGFYTVDQGEQAVELRFGKYQESKGAGLRWHIPAPIEAREIINTQRVNTVEVGYRKGDRNLSSVPREALMLTQDENIIDVQFAVQYDIKDPMNLLFNVSELNRDNTPEAVVRQATESAVREIVGRSTMDFAITEGRAQLAAETKTLVQRILDRYETGINIRTVEMQNAQPPSQVKNAFDDVVRAREDEERIKNLAQAYANDIIPRARGFAARILQEAEAYKESTVAQAEGQGARFEQVLREYAKAPAVTRDRLYLEAMEEVLSKSSKLMIDQAGGDSVMYLPLDQLLRQRAANAAAPRDPNSAAGTAPAASAAGDNTDRSNRFTNRNGRTQ